MVVFSYLVMVVRGRARGGSYLLTGQFFCCQIKAVKCSKLYWPFKLSKLKVLSLLEVETKLSFNSLNCPTLEFSADVYVLGRSDLGRYWVDRLVLILCAYETMRDYATHNHETYTIWRLGGGSGLCHRKGGPFSLPPPKFQRDRPLETAENHIFQFLERHNSNSFLPTPTIPIPYESPAYVV